MSKTNIHEGHRQRMYEKAEKIGYDNLPEHELLEIMLFSVIPRANTNVIAHELIKKFGSAYGAMTAAPDELTKIDGIGPTAAKFLNSLPMTMKAVAASKNAYIDKGYIKKGSTAEDLKDYICSQYLDADDEHVIVWYLSPSLKIIKRSSFGGGSFDSAEISKSQLAREAVITGAAYVILSHNHPSGLPFPSAEDRILTSEITDALNSVGVKLFDHIIIAGSDYYSFRESVL